MSVTAMQRGLERALARASQADDRELSGRVRADGLRTCVLLNGLIRSSRLYTGENVALEAPSAELARLVDGLVQMLGAVHLVCVEDQVYVNDIRLRVRSNDHEVLMSLIGELARHDVGGVSIQSPLAAADVRVLARAFSAPAEGEGAAVRTALASRLERLPSIELTGRYRFRLKGERAPGFRDAREVLQQGASVAREAIANLAAGRQPNPLPVRRAVIDLVDSLHADPARAAAASLRARALGAGIGETHALAVASVAVLVGIALGLDDGALSDLGVAAMLHDVGYARRPDRHGHAAAGLRLMLRQRGFHEGKIRRLAAVLDHHADASSRPHLFARLLHIADDYDVLTAPRPGKPPLPPPMAQASMWAARGTVYDADLLALFVQQMGLYPPGSVLELSDGRRVVSVGGGRDPDRFAWPVARVLTEGGAGETIDLYDQRDALRIKRIVNPATAGIEIRAVTCAADG